jgi:hypothetical protein
MAGWIAWQKGLTAKPEVVRMASILKVSRREAAAMCMEVWEWWDSNSANGFVPGLTAEQLSEVVAIPGVGEAMKAVDWLLVDRTGLHLPNWDRWNMDSAKARLSANRRQEKHRKQKGI